MCTHENGHCIKFNKRFVLVPALTLSLQVNRKLQKLSVYGTIDKTYFLSITKRICQLNNLILIYILFKFVFFFKKI